MAQPSGGSWVVTTWTALELVVACIRVSWGRTIAAVWSSAHLMYTVKRFIITIQYSLYHIICKQISQYCTTVINQKQINLNNTFETCTDYYIIDHKQIGLYNETVIDDKQINHTVHVPMQYKK